MTTTKVDKITPEERDLLRAELAQQIKNYLKKGGTITKCPPRTFSNIQDTKKKFTGSQFDSLTDPSNRDIGAIRPTKNKGGGD